MRPVICLHLLLLSHCMKEHQVKMLPFFYLFKRAEEQKNEEEMTQFTLLSGRYAVAKQASKSTSLIQYYEEEKTQFTRLSGRYAVANRQNRPTLLIKYYEKEQITVQFNFV